MNTRLTVFAIGIVVGMGACTTTPADTYTEQRDATNNWNVGGTPEDTGLTLFASGSIFIDGMVNSGHYDSEDLDNDTYTFVMGAPSTATITLTGSDANAALMTFDVAVLDPALVGVGSDVEVGAPTTAQLAPVTYILEVHAQNPQPITSSYPYTIEVSAGG